mgnify:FL=1|jgi:hypothetical protein
MKITAILITLLIGSTCFAQTLRNLNDTKTETIYRGFENKIVIYSDKVMSEDEYTLSSADITINKINNQGETLPPNTFILYTKEKSKIADLLIISEKGDTTTHQFKISNLPDPKLFLNEIESGESLPSNLENSKWVLSAKYPSIITLIANYKITSWACTIGNVTLSVENSNEIPEELINQINSLPSGSKVSFIATVLSEHDGICRKLSGGFTTN